MADERTDYLDGPDAQPRHKEGLGLDELAAIIASEIEAAKEGDRTNYSKDRERAINYYLGDMPDTPSQKGRSQAKSRDVADTIDWMLPGLMRVFLASPHVVEYQPRGEEDVEGAQQATDYINFKFLGDCNGYNVLWDVFHDSLTVRCGIAKAWWDTTPEYKTATYYDLDEAGFAKATEGEQVEILAHSEHQELVVDPETQRAVPVMLQDVKVRSLRSKGRLEVVSIPPEEFFIDTAATCIDDARFLCHVTTKTRSDLIGMGFDREKIEELPLDDGETNRPEALARQEDFSSGTEPSRMDKSMESVNVYETYILVDFDGDGVAEWMRCLMAGGKTDEHILAYEEWDDPIPFVEFNPFRIPHRWQGRSIADQTMDIQQIKTVLLRGTLDNIYAANNPQKVVIENEVQNPDEVLNPTFNGVIRVKTNPGAVVALSIPFFGDKTAEMMGLMDQMIEKRTGVSKTTMAIDPEALQNQSATAAQLQHDASYSKNELVARNLAEGGMKKLFSVILRLFVKHQDKPEVIRLNNKFVEMDPKDWNAEMDASIDVGLGAGSRDRDMAALMQVLGIQKEVIAQYGPDNPLCGVKEFQNTLTKLVETAGLRNGEMYFRTVTPDELKAFMEKQAAKPDPKAEAIKQKAQADQQMAQQKLQADMQAQQAKAQQDAQASQAKAVQDLQVKQAQMQADKELREQELAGKQALAREEMLARMNLEREKMNMEQALRVEEMKTEARLKELQIQTSAMARVNLPGDEANVRRPQ